MQGKVVVITGATSGLGQVAAERLAGMGARIVLIARNKTRAAEQLRRLAALATGQRHTAHYADLSSIRETRRAATEICGAEPRIDVLINNAGALYGGNRQVTVDGLELTFATNHMAYFVLTDGLLDRLQASAPSRIINTASDRAMVATLNFDDLQSTRGYNGYAAYCRSKLCNVYFTRVLAKRMQGTNVTVNAWNPGFTRTAFFQGKPLIVRLVNRIIGGNPRVRAQTLVYLASSPELMSTTGTFWAFGKPGRISATAQDDAQAERLWQLTEKVAAAT